jgi:hypothetical protein
MPHAAQGFAAGVLERAYAGWHIGSVAFRYPGTQELEVEVIMVDAARTQAQAFQWIIPEDEQGRGSHHVMRAEVPGERRVYSGEKAFFDLLASDPPVTVEVQSGGLWQFRGRRASATLGQEHYHVVVRHVGGDKAPALLATALTTALDQDGTLIAVQASSPSYGQSSGFSSVDFVVQGHQLQVIHALLDAQGRVMAVQLRRPGALELYDVYSQNNQLLDSLRAAKSVQRMRVNRSGQDLVSIDLMLEDDLQVTIDTSDFYEEEITGC